MANKYIRGKIEKKTKDKFICINTYCSKYNLPAKFLLQLPNKSEMNLVECFSQSERHIDDYSLAIIGHIHLTAREKKMLFR